MCASAHPPSLSWDAPYKTAHTARRTGIKEKISLRGSERFFSQESNSFPSIRRGCTTAESLGNLISARLIQRHNILSLFAPAQRINIEREGKAELEFAKMHEREKKKRDWRVSRDSARIKPLFSLCAVCVYLMIEFNGES